MFMLVTAPHGIQVEGYVAPGFERVRDAFVENFTRRHELGGGCAAYCHGEKVVDLWGGIRNKRTGEPWEQDTMVIVYSATKGLAAMTLALAHSRGWLDYDERVAAYWPEFAQNGKERITVRQLLAHQAGLYALDQRPTAASSPTSIAWPRCWRVRSRNGSLARSRRITESRSATMKESCCAGSIRGIAVLVSSSRTRSPLPLGLDVYIRLPEEIPNSRLATTAPPTKIDLLRGFPFRLALDTLNPHSKIVRALWGSELPIDEQRVYARNFEIASGGAVGTARAIARAYSAFATGGAELGLREETLDLLAAPAIPPARGFYDECIKGEAQFSLGFMKPSRGFPFGSPRAFGSPGAGGAMGLADPEAGVGYAYVTSQMGTNLSGDPRDVALRDALYAALRNQ